MTDINVYSGILAEDTLELLMQAEQQELESLAVKPSRSQVWRITLGGRVFPPASSGEAGSSKMVRPQSTLKSIVKQEGKF